VGIEWGPVVCLFVVPFGIKEIDVGVMPMVMLV
jgi:hypothetical protein